ncbi:DUF2092 domain-containing protein [Streptosporangium sp. NPDC048047]|uniref:LolA family protein n=1 Tax=Streptosporangium sp. NPDC048047 TaxID=3155748 RepID=UPI00343FB625
MRWGVPVAAMAVVAAAAGAGPVIAAVQGDPVLPERTASQLLADAVQAGRSGPKPMSGTLAQTASLGLPGLPDVSGFGGTSPAALLAGSHELKVWYGGADRMRFALPGRMSETDLIVNGGQAWLWESDANKATRLTGDTGAAARSEKAVPAAVTPQKLADDLLSRPGTVVGVTNTERVADRSAYQLTFAPEDASSLVREVRLALDGETLVPLRVQVYARSAAEPAFEVGFTSVAFTPPAPGNFAFTPPPGAKVEEKRIDDLAAVAGERAERAEDLRQEAKVIGEGWTAVAVLPFSEQDLKKRLPSADGEPPAGRTPTRDAGQDAGQGAGAVVDAVLKSARPVSGPWGSGRVVRTKLVSALLTDDGRLLVGAVTPEKLTEVAGQK